MMNRDMYFTLGSTDEAEYKTNMSTKKWEFSPIESWIYWKGFLLNGGLCSIGDTGASHEFELCDDVFKWKHNIDTIDMLWF